MDNTISHALLNESEVAERLGVSVSTIQSWRKRSLGQRGPKFLRVEGSIRYRPEDVEAYLASRPTGGEAA